jgi:predicted permease
MASAVRHWRGEPVRWCASLDGSLSRAFRGGEIIAFSVFAQVLLPIVVVVASGYLLQRRLKLDLRSVNRLSLYLLSPALIFSSLVQSRIEASETLRISAFMTLFVISIGALAWLVALLLRLDSIDSAALMLCVMFMNAGNYGLPAARFAFGQEGFDRAVLLFVVQAILTQTLAIYIAGAGHGDRRGSLVRLLGMPQIYAVLAALAVRVGGLRLDPTGSGILNDAFRGVALVGDAAVPLLLIILGLQLAETGRISEGSRVALATAMRLGLSVPLAVILSYLLDLDELSTKLAVMLSSMPTAVNVIILAIEFNVRPRFVSSVVVVSTAASVFTLTLILVLLGVR